MKRKTISDAITNISSEYIEKAADYTVSRKRRKPIWMKWTAMAACLCLVVATAVILIPNNSPQLDLAQTISYNGFEYWVCGTEGEVAILKECGLPDKLTADLAGDLLGYVEIRNKNSLTISDSISNIPLFEFAPQPNDNVYILKIDNDYYAAIRRDNGNYQGLPQKDNNSIQKQDEIGSDYFNAMVLEIHADYVIVEHLDISSDLIFESKTIEVTTSNVVMENGVPELKVGDNVRIIIGESDGIVSDKIDLVIKIQMLDKNGNPISSKNGES